MCVRVGLRRCAGAVGLLLSVAALGGVFANERPLSERLSAGRELYTRNCVLCHGVSGEGDGRMSKLIVEPPPADLTASRLSPAALERIVTKGGAAVGRSDRMPSWRTVLKPSDVQSIITYLQTLKAVP